MKGLEKFKYIYVLMLFVIVTTITGCVSSYERVEIIVPSDVKEAIENITPAQEYGYYALESAQPGEVEDLTNKTLFVCGDVGSNIDLKIAASSITSLGKYLFKSSKVHFINENISCEGSGPCATLSEDLSFSEGDSSFYRESLVYGKDVTYETIFGNCLEAMQEDPESVILVRKGALKQQADIVEIMFR